VRPDDAQATPSGAVSLDSRDARMNFDIGTEQLDGDSNVTSLSGEGDLYTAPELEQQLLEAIGQAKGLSRLAYPAWVWAISETTFVCDGAPTGIGVPQGG